MTEQPATAVRLDLPAAPCWRCQSQNRDDECICPTLFAANDARQAAGEMPWQTRPRKANRTGSTPN